LIARPTERADSGTPDTESSSAPRAATGNGIPKFPRAGAAARSPNTGRPWIVHRPALQIMADLPLLLGLRIVTSPEQHLNVVALLRCSIGMRDRHPHVAEVPANRQQDHLRWEPETNKRSGHSSATANHPNTLAAGYPIRQRNSAVSGTHRLTLMVGPRWEHLDPRSCSSR
jgi:hypothetical protein